MMTDTPPTETVTRGRTEALAVRLVRAVEADRLGVLHPDEGVAPARALLLFATFCAALQEVVA